VTLAAALLAIGARPRVSALEEEIVLGVSGALAISRGLVSIRGPLVRIRLRLVLV
jgi:hypothetical protein